jgi:hypothetical protein
VTDRDELRHPVFVGLHQKLNRIAAVARRFSMPVRFARHGVAQRPAFGSPFIRRAITPGKTPAPFPDANDVAFLVAWFWQASLHAQLAAVALIWIDLIHEIAPS